MTKSWHRKTGVALMLAALALGLVSARGAEVVPGPVEATVTAVIDGDTLAVRARVWLGQEVTIRVRLAGVDAPELAGRCPDERARALAARAFLADRVGDGRVLLQDIRYGKFAGRVVARVVDPQGRDLGRALLEAGLARAYGGGRRRPWCPRETVSSGADRP